MNAFIHPDADVAAKKVGDGTRIWQFTVVLADAQIGSDCNICAHTFIENDVVIGDNVTIRNGVQLWDGIRLEDGVFVGPNVTFTNDLFPRPEAPPKEFLQTVVKTGASIGANATIMRGSTIGERAMIGAGSVVTRSVPTNAIVVGNPARIVGYTDTKTAEYTPPKDNVSTAGAPDRFDTAVRGVTVSQFPIIGDMRGELTVGEFRKHMPFTPERYFIVFNVPSQEVRGEHAHRVCHQFLVCVRGSCSVMADDGKNRIEVALDAPNKGIYLPPMVWGVQYKYSADAALLVFASHPYDAEDYIRNYNDFIDEVNRQAGS